MQVEVGEILEGKITGLTAFGAFVDIGEGGTGMVHISEVSVTYVKDIKDHLSVGQDVKVKVLSVGDDGKISLSIKKAQPPAPRPEQSGRPERQDRGGRPNRQTRSSNPPVWQGTKPAASTEGQSFEDMMARFKQVSDEKMGDLKRSTETKHGAGYSRRGGGK